MLVFKPLIQRINHLKSRLPPEGLICLTETFENKSDGDILIGYLSEGPERENVTWTRAPWIFTILVVDEFGGIMKDSFIEITGTG